MCCPHGQAFKDNLKCGNVEGGLNYDPKLWDNNEKVFLNNWKKDEHFLLVGPKYSLEDRNESIPFQCPKDPDNLDNEMTFNEDNGYFRILMNGKLEEKEDIESWIYENNTSQKDSKIWSSDSFCVIYTNSDYFYYDYGEEVDTTEDPYSGFNYMFMTCHAETLSWCEKFTSTFQISCFTTSTIFLIVTLLVYMCEDSLRRTNPLFSKLTIAFILNLIICFIVLIDNQLLYLTKDKLNTVRCILSGYMRQYFFLGVFFWISAMSFNIWLKFTQMSMKAPSMEKENKNFLKYFAYAQGTPFLIALITAIVDATGKGETNYETLIHHPNMGVYVCFVGAPTIFKQVYLGQPTFIYFHLFVLITQLSNGVFLGLTIKSLYAGWRNQANLHKMIRK